MYSNVKVCVNEDDFSFKVKMTYVEALQEEVATQCIADGAGIEPTLLEETQCQVKEEPPQPSETTITSKVKNKETKDLIKGKEENLKQETEETQALADEINLPLPSETDSEENQEMSKMIDEQEEENRQEKQEIQDLQQEEEEKEQEEAAKVAKDEEI